LIWKEPMMKTVSRLNADAPALPEPWWRVGVMWLFVGGLGAVVIGSFALLATAIVHADVVLPQTPMVPAGYATKTAPAP
jgi:hypothetical protein